MTCGAHAHENLTHGHGCGLEFHWNQARPYRPHLADALRQPPGFSAILAWVMKDQDYSSAEAAQGAEAALQGLSQEDRRYAIANACACAFLKRDQTQPALAQALLREPSGPLHAALGLQHAKLATCPRLSHFHLLLLAVLCLRYPLVLVFA